MNPGHDPVDARSSSGAIGIVANPRAGKDVRRLLAPSAHTSDGAKSGIVRRSIIAALETGATRVLLMGDRNGIAERAKEGLGSTVKIVGTDLRGNRSDTLEAVRAFRDQGVGAVIALGGDGTCRDLVTAWADAPLIAVSTGTNNVFPGSLDATSAGVAAALIACRRVDLSTVSRRAKRIVVRIDDGPSHVDDVALVDLALVRGEFVGARAVDDPTSLTAVVAAIASPASTGLSSIVGRLHPLDRWSPGGIVVRVGPTGRPLRVPLIPGRFETIGVESVGLLGENEPVMFNGPCILAFDGERDRTVSHEGSITARILTDGPQMIDVESTLIHAASAGFFVGECHSSSSRSRRDHVH